MCFGNNRHGPAKTEPCSLRVSNYFRKRVDSVIADLVRFHVLEINFFWKSVSNTFVRNQYGNQNGGKCLLGTDPQV